VHPLDPLSAVEIRAAAEAVRTAQPQLDRPAFPLIALEDPPKGDEAPARRARVVVLERGTGTTYEAIVALQGASVESWRAVPGVQPAIMAEETELAARAARGDPRFVAGLRRRGIEDPEQVQIDPLSVGFYPHLPQGRRILWATPYLRPQPTDNGYARPIENLRACVDIATGEVVEVIDGDAVPLSSAGGNYDAQAVGGHRTDLRPLEIVQPEGPSFSLDGHQLRWQGWSVHVALHPIDGLVLSDVRYAGRQVLHRAALAEMIVPYGDPDDGFFWRSYFDAGEYGIGQTTVSLARGCDCLGEIRYLDAVLATGDGEPAITENAICIHEEDAGILWKHHDTVAGTSEVRRARRLVVSNVATLGNYDYGFYWLLYQDGSIELEVRMTGIVLTRGVRPGQPLRHATRLAADLAAPHHQHLFNVRLDMAVDGFANRVYEVDMVPAPPGADNPHGSAMQTTETLIERERDGRRMIDPLAARHWRIVNAGKRNAAGDPVAYKLVPHAGPLLLAHPDSSVGRRAGFARAHLWVTRYARGELHAAGDYPNQHPGGPGLEDWIAQDRDLVDTDVVLWHTFGASHAVRPEDWPVMPVERAGFALRPVGFFDRNPAIDVAPPEAC
jgi:primary-amine oxidase